jgi:glycosyltransferase involved in cell wall biosynthesis
MEEINRLAVVFSGDLSEKGGIQSWVKTLKSESLEIEHISLKCTRTNFHYPAFKSNKRKETYKVVICCDPLSLIWASQNIKTSRLVIGVFHKDEWKLNENNTFEMPIIRMFSSCAGILKLDYVKIENLPASLQTINLSLIPRKFFSTASRIKEKGKDILILGRLEAFKGYPIYLTNFAKTIYNFDPSIKIHVVGKGVLFDELNFNKIDNTIFHGYLDENEIYQIAKGCMLGLSSGLSAIELSKVGLPVAVAKEDTAEMLLTCFTGNGYFIFQDDYDNSEDLELMEVVETIYKSSANDWEDYSLKAKSISNDKCQVDALLDINEIQISSRQPNFILYVNYLIYVILDKLKLVKFNFIHRIK